MTELACVTATVTGRTKLSEHLVRVRVAGQELRIMPWGDQGPGPRTDAYLKVLIPPTPGATVAVDVSDMTRWRREFMAAPPERRGWLRTYTVRDAAEVELAGHTVPELAIDVVLHDDPEHGMGPGAAWGDTVREGQDVQLLVPSGGSPWWAAWDERRAADQDVVLAGDETALPALAAIIDGIERGVHVGVPAPSAPPRSVTIAVEVPSEDDAVAAAGPRALARATSSDGHTLTVTLRGGTELHWTWLPRRGRPRGLDLELWLWHRLSERARRYWEVGHGEPEAAPSEEADFVWDVARPEGRGTYWFFAAESATVKSLRRMCVSGGVPKTDISFMGYWKQGAATE